MAKDVIAQIPNAGRNISFFQSLHPTECTITNRSNAFLNMYLCNLIKIGFPWTQIIVCANNCISNSIIIGHWAIAKNSQNLCRFIVFPLNTLFLILCTTITIGFCFAFGAIIASNSGCLRSIGARFLCKRRNRSSRHHGNCHAHCQGGADHSFQSHKNPPFMNYSQNITMPAQSKKSAAPAKWLVQRSAFCTLGIYRPLR